MTQMTVRPPVAKAFSRDRHCALDKSSKPLCDNDIYFLNTIIGASKKTDFCIKKIYQYLIKRVKERNQCFSLVRVIARAI